MSRLPVTGSDDGTWGNILNDFLGVEHNADGTQKTVSIAKGGTGATTASAALSNLGGFAPAAAPAVFTQVASGGHASGFANGGTLSAAGKGAFANGYIKNTGSINGYAGGSLAHGWVGNGAIVKAANIGSFAGGYAYGTGSYIRAWGAGSMAHGTTYAGGMVKSAGLGSVALGTARNGAVIYGGRSGFRGALAGGYTSGFPAPVTSTIYASGYGAFAWGKAYGASSTIKSTSSGSFALGYTYGVGSSVEATGSGSFALGYAKAGHKVHTANLGSFAFGAADSGDVSASGVNTMQLGVGTNTLARSVQIGSAGLRFKMDTGAPAIPQNGDIWVDATGNITIRSNGITKTL